MLGQGAKIGWPLEGPSWPQNLPMVVSPYVPEGRNHLTAAEAAADSNFSIFDDLNKNSLKMMMTVSQKGLLHTPPRVGVHTVWFGLI